MFGNRWFKISAISGILCFALSSLSIEYQIESTNITLLWSLIFPVVVSLAYGKRGAIVSSIFGGMWFPILLWPENGLGLIPNIIDYAIFYLLIGYIADKTKGKGSSFKEILLPIVFFIVFDIFSLLFVFKWLLSLSGNDISYWVASVIIIKRSFYFVFIIILSETLLRTNIVREFLHLEINIYGKNNLKLLAYSFLSSFIIWLSFYLLDKILMPSNTEKQYLGLLFMVLIFGSSIISRWLIYSSEKQLKAEIALEESKRKLHAIFDHHFQLTGLIDTNGRLQTANQTALQFANIKESEIIGKLFWDTPFWAESQKKEVKNAFNRAIKGEFVRFETFHHTPKGEVRNFDFSFKPVKDKNGRVIYVVPEGRDITEIRVAEESLKENELRLRNLSDNLPYGMTYQLDMGKDGEKREFTYVSAGVERIHELTASEVLKDATLLCKQLFEEDLAHVAELENQAKENMTPFIAEARFKLPSGAIQWHLLTSAPRIALNGHLIWDGIELDITKRKQVELEIEDYKNHLEKLVKERTEDLEAANEELLSSNEELYRTNKTINKQRAQLEQTLHQLKETQSQLVQTEKMASLGVLTAGVAHEINNPLNYILGSYSGLQIVLKENYENNETVATLLKSMKIGIYRATNIVKSLNQFSRSQDKLDEKCDIHSILDNCILILNNQLKDRIEVAKNYTEKPIVIEGNSGKLHQVFLNILTNSVHAIEKNGTIQIKTLAHQKYISIEIIDSGSGISQKNLSKVMDPFFTTKDAGKGTGLGLSISYTIIKEHKGEIKFSSEENKGTIVKIKLPIANESE